MAWKKSISTGSLAGGCARHPVFVIGLWILLLVAGSVLAMTLLQGTLTSEIRFTNGPESERADALLQERFPEADGYSELFIVEADSSTVSDPAFRQHVEALRDNLLALSDDVIDETKGVTYYYPLMDQANEYIGLAQLLNALAAMPDLQRQFAVAALPVEQGQAVLSALDIQTVQELPPAEVIITTARALEAGAAQLTTAAGQLVSSDGTATLLRVTMAGDLNEATSNIGLLREVAAQGRGEGFNVAVTGDASFNSDVFDIADKDLQKGDSIGIPVALIVLAIVFGALAAAFIPVVLSIAAIVVALGITSLIGQGFDLTFFVTNIIFMLGLGVGIDYSLFIISRYREERREGVEKIEAIAAAGSTASRAVLFSGMTVALAVMGILLVPSNLHRSLSLGAVVVVAMTVVAALTLLPAVLSIMGDRVNALRVPMLRKESEKRKRGENSGFWDWITRRVMTHPVIGVVLAGGILLACAYPSLDMKMGQSNVSTLPSGYESKDGLDILSEKFSPGLMAPVKIVIDGYDDPDVQLATQTLQANIASDPAFSVSQLQVNADGDLALMTVIMSGDPYSSEARNTVVDLRDQQVPEAFDGLGNDALVTGFVASRYDFGKVVSDYTPLIFGAVLSLSFLLLMLAFRSIVVPAKAVIMNLLSVGAAYGLIVLVFQKGVGASTLGFQQVDCIDSWVPIFLFCALFGLSMDYHVFLLSRIREHYDQTNDNTESVAFGIRTTAGLITGAALIMVAVFGSFALGQFALMQQLGFGLAVAVAMDATIVRVVLVPSTMKLLGRANWYFPSWLGWLPDVRVETGPQPAKEPSGERGTYREVPDYVYAALGATYLHEDSPTPLFGGATSAPVMVTTVGGTSNGPVFTVIPSPTISSIFPTLGAVGSVVTLCGTNFGSSRGSSVVKLNGVPVTDYISWSDTEIKCMVPDSAATEISEDAQLDSEIEEVGVK